MKLCIGVNSKWTAAFAALLIALGCAWGRENPKPPQFKYAGGTMKLAEDCEGTLELTTSDLTFKCPSGSIAIPYSAITLLQYRSDVSSQVRRLKIKWRVRPSGGGGKKNHLFTVVFTQEGAPQVVVLSVPSQAMRPYLAEIDLKAGKRVEVQNHEDY